MDMNLSQGIMPYSPLSIAMELILVGKLRNGWKACWVKGVQSAEFKQEELKKAPDIVLKSPLLCC